MQDYRLEERNNQYKTEMTAETLRNSSQRQKLFLRKQKMDSMLLSKRLNFIPDAFSQLSPKELTLPEYITSDVEKYIKTEFNVKTIFKPILSNDIPQIKNAIFLLRNYIVLQSELPQSKKFLSRNDFDLVNRLCSLVLIHDEQIKYEASLCLINLKSFSENVQNRIFTPENLNLIYEGFLQSEGALQVNFIQLISNCCSSRLQNQRYFLNKGIMDILEKSFSNELCTNDLLLNLSRCTVNLSKYIRNDPGALRFFLSSFPFLAVHFRRLLQDTTQNEIILILIVRIFENLTFEVNQKFFDAFLSQSGKDIIDCYNNIKPSLTGKVNPLRGELLELYNNIMMGTDSQVNKLIDEGILAIYKQCLDDFKYQNREYLRIVLFSLSNIAVGNLGQCISIMQSNVLLDVLELSNMFYKVQEQYKEDKESAVLLKECIFVISGCLEGGGKEVGYQVIIYQDNLAGKILKWGLQNFDKDNLLLLKVVSSFERLIVFEENDMNDTPFKKFMKDEDIKEILEKIIFEKKIPEETVIICERVIDSLRDEFPDFNVNN